MRILFFSFYNKFDIDIHPGVAVLSAALKKHGHKTKLQPYFYYDEEIFKKTLSEFQPNVIGISATHMAVSQVKKLAKFLKQITNVPILLGGVFPILSSKEALSIEGIDAICIGEGVDGLLQFINGEKTATNYIFKDNPNEYKIENWSKEPISDMDYDIFIEAMPPSKKINKLDYWTSFTCEYGCSFCCNKEIRRITGLSSKPRQDVNTAIENLQQLIKKTSASKIHFRDPLFMGPSERCYVKEFLKEYSKKIALPYICNLRANSIDDEIAQLLKKTGCYKVKMGLETGSEVIRNKLLHKADTDEDFINASKRLREVDIKLSLNAMIGLAYETLESANRTMNFIQELKATKVFLHIFQPWPGLELDNEIRQYIKYIKSPALNDILVAGKKVKEFMSGYNYDFEKANKEYIYYPVLDQPQFPFDLAARLQREFHERIY
ncbi:B12-binding domain-containing radical SAM protein [Abyssisolibacter fermentans]|uniref:B12-binding domain-containing radical SAM protein n=1 Tax=Abyssisolibacter fermentans TaxID=1766203 RepID=UPI000833FD48|nr:cobalamin-dependent protein [Abyssisolibacter fermentans]